ncbi:hypothetical protein SORBI_3006G150500, partial [Sorghum bicolor]
ILRIYYYQNENSTAELRARVIQSQFLSVSLWGHPKRAPRRCDLFYGACKPIPEIHWSKLALVGNAI